MTNSLPNDTPTSLVLKNAYSPGIINLTLNNPSQYNALSEEMLSAMISTIDEIRDNSDIKVVILSANGKAFCAGHDLKQMRARPDESYYEDLFSRCTKMMMALASMPQIVVAKVDGMATAAGCQLVANADLAISSNAARFAVSGINLGLFCSTPSVPLSRNVSRKRAFEMLTTGEFIDAETAVDYGLINHAVPAEELDAAVDRLVKNIASKPSQALQAGKALFYRQLNMPLVDAYATAGRTMAKNMLFDDTIEGISAFIDKRKPDWN